MKSKIIIILASIGLLSLPVSAQEQAYQEIGLGLGLGISSLSMNEPTQPIGINFEHGAGGNIGASYTLFLTRQFGIGTGVELALYNSKYTSKSLLDKKTGIEDPLYEGETYTFQYAYYNWEEQESALAVQIPLFLQFQTLGEYQFYIQAGGKYGFNFQPTSTTTANRMVTSGLFSYENVTYSSGPYGFRAIDNYKHEQELYLKNPMLMASLEMGLKWQLENNNAFYTGLFLDYGINNLLKSNTKSLVEYHYDGPEYVTANSITMTPSVEKIKTLAVGIRVHFAFSVGKTFGMTPAKMVDPKPMIFDTPPAVTRENISLDAKTYRMPDKPAPQPTQPKKESAAPVTKVVPAENIPQPQIENESQKPSLTPPATLQTHSQQVASTQATNANKNIRPVQPATTTRPASAQQSTQQTLSDDEAAEMLARQLFAAGNTGSASVTTPPPTTTSPFKKPTVDTQSIGGTEYYNPNAGRNTRMIPAKKPTQEDLFILGGPLLGYAEGEARLSIEMAQELDKKALILQQYPQLYLIVETYSCNSIKDQSAGLKRAENIKEYLVIQGVDPDRITTVYKGSINPIAPNDKESNRKQNRRALFIIGSL